MVCVVGGRGVVKYGMEREHEPHCGSSSTIASIGASASKHQAAALPARLSATWGICTRRAGKLNRARSQLYRSQILQVNTRWKALAEIYTMHSFAPFWNRIPKTRKTMGRKEPGPYNPGKTWPGEAHKQPQLATQYYLRAQVEECLRIRNEVMTGDFPLSSRRDAYEC